MNANKRTIAIVAGGDSGEYEVSLRSAEGITSFLDKECYMVYTVIIRGTDWNVQCPTVPPPHRPLRRAEEALERLSQEQERILSETRTEQAQMLQEAASQRDAMIARAREDARLQADVLIKEAKERINEEKEAALRDVHREVALMSISIAEKVVRKEMSSEKGQKEFIDRMVAEMLDNEKTSSSEAVN